MKTSLVIMMLAMSVTAHAQSKLYSCYGVASLAAAALDRINFDQSNSPSTSFQTVKDDRQSAVVDVQIGGGLNRIYRVTMTKLSAAQLKAGVATTSTGCYIQSVTRQ